MIAKKILESIQVKEQIVNDSERIKTIENAAKIIIEAFEKDHRVYFCGNGGSAADAQHLAAELSGKFYLDRPALPAEACHGNSSFVTAIANDYNFDKIYSRFVEGFGKKGDVLVGISTSGNSANIINAFKTAKEKGMILIGFTGETGGKMKEQVDVLINVPSTDTSRIQE